MNYVPLSVVTLLEILETSAGDFYRLSAMIGQIVILLENNQVNTDNARIVIASLGEMERLCTALNLPFALLQLKKIKEFLSDPKSDPAAALRPLVVEMHTRVCEELDGRFFLVVPHENVGKYVQAQPLFGAEVEAKFPSVSYEIREAGKCLALSRSTAGAFHSVRCLEAGVRAMSRCLAIPDPIKARDRTWGNVLNAIKSEITRRWAPNMLNHGPDNELFENAHAALAAMQNPWRNSTMHLDQTYTLEDANHIFEIVGGFMRKIASRMDEQGLPLA